MTLSNMATITGLHTNLFSMTLALQNIFQVKSEVKTLILRKISTETRFGEKMANRAGK